ncbi:MAG TPA: PASTA domain-containing protein [Gaiellaceae bacterium]|jgi:hypothetical protein
MIRSCAALVAAALALSCVACGSTDPHRAPDLVGERLDLAEETLDAVGLRYRTVGGGLFGIVVRSHWSVCRQSPSPGVLTRSVTLFVDRDCFPTYDD